MLRSGRVALAVTRQGSHRPVRAHIRAYGSLASRLAARKGPKAIRSSSSMCSASFPRLSLLADTSLPSTGSSGASSPVSTVLSKRYDFLPPVPPRFVAFAWRYLGCTRSVRSSVDECAAEAWSCSPGDSGREITEETTGSPKFLGNPNSPSAHVQSTPAGLLAPDR